MTDNATSFLLAEYKASFDMIINIDNRRGVFLHYYAILFGATATVSGALFGRMGVDMETYTKISLVVLYLATALTGGAIICVILSERRANVRYRARINQIRQLLLKDDDPASIGETYLRSEQHSPKGLGRTLKFVIPVIAMQAATATVAALILGLSIYLSKA